MSSREFSEWIAFADVEPFGPEREDLRAALICWVIAEVNRDRKKRPQKYKVTDFLPRFDREQKKQTWEDQLRLVEMMNVAFGGRDEREK